ncbi:ATP-binding protein [Rhodoferax sp.]|uniref:ATP-binding protein n=1 Tax=Rhodoferax sp. TaxID=50421 RepID=UPI002620FA5A|nr:ATP-binding protein [Rhodoferax sp.]
MCAQTLTFGFVLAERGLVMREVMIAYLTADVASSVAMLDRLPADERASWIARLDRPNYRFVLAARPYSSHTTASSSPLARPVTQALSEALSESVSAIDAMQPGVELRLLLQLQDGSQLAVDLLEPRLRLSPWLLASLTGQLILIAAGCWLAVRQATRPLSELAAAARSLKPGEATPALPLTGPREVVDAAQAFNIMRQRIDEHLAERSEMLGAISHDLQTPITRMRLRADLMQDEVMRAKLHADLEQMQHLVEQGLAYARSAQAGQELEVSTDLLALLQSTVADYQDAGQPVQWLGDSQAVVRTRPKALRRVISNLIDNSIKFAGAAEVRLVRENGQPAIQVLDRGPGIPADEDAKVRQPFYRIEISRSPSTGGSGLGLAIVQRLAPLCHAQLRLLPRDGGGLCAEIRFQSMDA